MPNAIFNSRILIAFGWKRKLEELFCKCSVFGFLFFFQFRKMGYLFVRHCGLRFQSGKFLNTLFLICSLNLCFTISVSDKPPSEVPSNLMAAFGAAESVRRVLVR